jgi:hypothetical protein
MLEQRPHSDNLGTRAALGRRRLLQAALAASSLAVLTSASVSWAQDTWRGLSVPRYPRATDYHVKTDRDEYDIYFRSRDTVESVFNFYRDSLERQGFRIMSSRPTSHGLEAHLVRGAGGPDNIIELNAKLEHGWYEVEIEFDD